jgi:hypothetical protein
MDHKSNMILYHKIIEINPSLHHISGFRPRGLSTPPGEPVKVMTWKTSDIVNLEMWRAGEMGEVMRAFRHTGA